MLINEQIRAKEVLVIGPKGEQLGLKSREDALTLASVAGFDLVLMNANAEKPVCKLMDYNKYKYEKAKKMKEASKKQRENNTELKEYRLSVNIDIHDFNTRVKQASKYIEKGHRIKASIRCTYKIRRCVKRIWCCRKTTNYGNEKYVYDDCTNKEGRKVKWEKLS